MNPPPPARPLCVLVTGASSGIGKATAVLLAAEGMKVFAGVRHFSPEKPGQRIEEILLDVTCPDSIAAAVREISSRTGGDGLDALVNNAGIGAIAPVEFIGRKSLQDVFEVNVFGLVAVTQAFLPLLRQARGSIVNIGSIGGMITMPFGVALCAAKHAVESVSDALRLELHSSGIRVSLIQPASINSGAAEKLAKETGTTIAAMPPEGRELYAPLLNGFVRKVLKEESAGSPPEVVARAVLGNIRNPAPPARRLVGKHAYALGLLARFAPAALRENLLRFLFLKPS
ncbi:MAG: SDR family oxidoreductase [Terrimicrobiaceae bacterium]